MLIGGLDTALKNAQAGKSEVEAANRELYESQNRLEESRNDLLIINEQLQRRTERINSIAEISKTVTSIQEIRLLLSSVVNTISHRFGYYHVGIYLMDEQKQFAVLRASNSEGGLSMIEKNHRLRIGEQSVVGFVAHSGQSHMVTETATDKSFFNDPDLPDSLSEMALPLRSGDELIGVLDIQSPKINAFSEDDISTLPILADQVAIAIQNAFLFERSQRLLREAEAASKQASQQEWKAYEKVLQTKGYRYDGIKSEALQGTELAPAPNKLLNIPVRLRGQTIGNLKLKPVDASHRWTEDELAIIEATSDRVALALEGSRLLDEAQKRATRESFLSDVAARLSTSFQLDSILRDTVEELGKNLKGSTVSFQLVQPSSDTPSIESQRSNGASASKKEAE
jgi:GAF domain-containing protein